MGVSSFSVAGPLKGAPPRLASKPAELPAEDPFKAEFERVKLLAEIANAYKPAKTTDCGFTGQVEIRFDFDEDMRAGCEGYGRSRAFFEKGGLPTNSRIVLTFAPEVRVPAERDENGTETIGSGMLVVGMWAAGLDSLRMTSLSAPWLKERLYFGLAFSQEMLTTVVAHEVTHAFNKEQYVNGRDGGSSHAADEFIAYWTQLSVMDPSLREQVLAKYPASEYSSLEDGGINSMSHATQPHAYGVRSYRRAQSEVPWAVAKRIYSGAFIE